MVDTKSRDYSNLAWLSLSIGTRAAFSTHPSSSNKGQKWRAEYY